MVKEELYEEHYGAVDKAVCVYVCERENKMKLCYE